MNQSPLIQIIESGQTARMVELRGTSTLGRDTDNDIVIDELTVSRCHAVLLVRPQGIVLVDLDSTNGTQVNGRQAQPDEAMPLAGGAIITLGRVVVRNHAAPPPKR